MITLMITPVRTATRITELAEVHTAPIARKSRYKTLLMIDEHTV